MRSRWAGRARPCCCAGLGTIGFNVAHAYLIGGRGDPLTVWRCVVASLPPVLMILSFQVLIAIVKWVMFHLGRPLNSAAALAPTMPVPGYGLVPPPGPYGLFPPHPVYGQVPSAQDAKTGTGENGGGEQPEPTKRAAVEVFLSRLAPEELGLATAAARVVTGTWPARASRCEETYAGRDPGGVAASPTRPPPRPGARAGRSASSRLGPGELLAAPGELGCARAAAVYAALGFPVVPMHAASPQGSCSCPDPACSDPGKHPRLGGWQRLASTDPATVGEWWRRWPDANLGLATGRRFDVLDLDGDLGVEALRAALSIAPPEHPGPVARTGGGGWHLLYAPTGLGNRVGLLAGVDWRGRHGLIVAPPSRHASGTATPGPGP